MRKIFALDDNFVIDVYNTNCTNNKLDMYLDKITRELGCKIEDKYSNIKDMPKTFEYIRKMRGARKICLKEKSRYAAVHNFYESDDMVKEPVINRYYFEEDPFVIALSNCHGAKAVSYYSWESIHPKWYVKYSDDIVDFNFLYKYLQENDELDRNISNYLVEYLELLDIDFDNFSQINMKNLDYNSGDAVLLEKLVSYYKLDCSINLYNDSYQEINEYQDYIFYPKRTALTIASNNAKVLEKLKNS